MYKSANISGRGDVNMNAEMPAAKIEVSGCSKSEIAEALGITRQGLYNKLSGENKFKF